MCLDCGLVSSCLIHLPFHRLSLHPTYHHHHHSIDKGFIQKQRQRSSLLFGGQNWFSSLPNRFSARMIWRNGWIEKWTLRGMDVSEQLDYTPFSLHHTKPHPPKMDVHTNFFLQIILAAKWLTRDSSTSLKLQRRPLPSLLYKSFFYAATESPVFILSAYLLA